MGNLVAADITVTLLTQRRNNGRNYFNVKLAFGDSSKTYPAGGVPVDISKLGCPNIVESLVIYDTGISGYNWSYDRINKKLVAIQAAGGSTATHNHVLFLKDAAQADGATTRVNTAAANKLGANTGTSISVAGVADTSGNGGIVSAAALSIAAAPGAEPSAVAIVAQTLKVEIIGW